MSRGIVLMLISRSSAAQNCSSSKFYESYVFIAPKANFFCFKRNVSYDISHEKYLKKEPFLSHYNNNIFKNKLDRI